MAHEKGIDRSLQRKRKKRERKATKKPRMAGGRGWRFRDQLEQALQAVAHFDTTVLGNVRFGRRPSQRIRFLTDNPEEELTVALEVYANLFGWKRPAHVITRDRRKYGRVAFLVGLLLGPDEYMLLRNVSRFDPDDPMAKRRNAIKAKPDWEYGITPVIEYYRDPAKGKAKAKRLLLRYMDTYLSERASLTLRSVIDAAGMSDEYEFRKIELEMGG